MELIPTIDFLSCASVARGAPTGRRLYIETYGCQMNVNDSEVVAAILLERGYGLVDRPEEADVVLLNTCSIRERAEERVRHRLQYLRALKRTRRPGMIIGVLGCMAERLKRRLLEEERLVDVVAGPDAYRDLPRLIEEAAETGQAAVNVLLSREETYADIAPVRLSSNGVTAFVSIMRGCDNFCSFCVVPFTRGRERSRPVESILREVEQLLASGYREVTLLGQNVNSYRYGQVSFAELLYRVSLLDPNLRVRFSTSHPKDVSDELIQVIAERPNVCRQIHLPVQSGSTRVLERMRRTYSREQYLELVAKIRSAMPDVGLSTDVIAGFCGETEEDHEQTLSLLEEVRFDMAYMFAYSEREGTYAAKYLRDDVPPAVKRRRLEEIIALQNRISLEQHRAKIGSRQIVLIEQTSKRSDQEWMGRADNGMVVVFPKERYRPGQYVEVLIEGATSATLRGRALRELEDLRTATGRLQPEVLT
ncbi:MAG: tRNA (N6-isopentenyl adenosine(37)-C2)-methylthiotransferase MiaB [Bacteroidetes bacterium]|nr:tRNA (N6-isopentenyl adenosine(37)-C2)-methylthiotransferase MiaB [Rhodothermia bacterium]MCS7155120.1 tRNA (N6-isopentenyl adenosine(37)-C2)-methylthiotransferase MiaB [Bacteroidota bacterium]MCX7906243.1 tRNA (N6-isopentenyl adenosine(37)-C2)-methylthiotransferase MiaB [Bacteroidota bacterium]MDW8138771.1 tRNA (N6-isopentenyl adenosine(37)-C2)-methylthiotransferase MiaB [Bacteroidota bacterium]MDW8286424.1 tRNA (N6-isopentenyl adenosine(37)-C2)-methylthiotransferase MiaB [Bacteroidota bact